METIKEFFEKQVDKNPFQVWQLTKDLIKLEHIEQRLNVLYGIELDIKVKPVKRKIGKFYGEGIIDAVLKEEINN